MSDLDSLMRQAEAWLQQGRIGRILAIQSSFGFRCDYDPQHRNFNPALAGGTLLDIGIYNLSLSQWAMANYVCPVEAQAEAVKQAMLERMAAGEPAGRGPISEVRDSRISYAVGSASA